MTKTLGAYQFDNVPHLQRTKPNHLLPIKSGAKKRASVTSGEGNKCGGMGHALGHLASVSECCHVQEHTQAALAATQRGVCYPRIACMSKLDTRFL